MLTVGLFVRPLVVAGTVDVNFNAVLFFDTLAKFAQTRKAVNKGVECPLGMQ